TVAQPLKFGKSLRYAQPRPNPPDRPRPSLAPLRLRADPAAGAAGRLRPRCAPSPGRWSRIDRWRVVVVVGHPRLQPPGTECRRHRTALENVACDVRRPHA